jgi:hypothetical protein
MSHSYMLGLDPSPKTNVSALLSVLAVFTSFINLRRFWLLQMCLRYMNIKVSELHKTANSAVETPAYVHSTGAILPTNYTAFIIQCSVSPL